MNKPVAQIFELFVLCLVGLSSMNTRCFALETTGNWLFIGDSHSVRGFGDGVRETLFRSEAHLDKRFYQLSVSGSMASQWLDGSVTQLDINCARKVPGFEKEVVAGKAPQGFRSFAELNKELKPTHLIIALGTNESSLFAREVKAYNVSPSSKSSEREKLLEANVSPMRRLLNENPTARCALILPPRLKTAKIPPLLHNEFTDALLGIAQKRGCLVVDSRLIRDLGAVPEVKKWQDCLVNGGSEAQTKMLHADQKDGIHFFHTKGEYWGKCVALLIEETWKDAQK